MKPTFSPGINGFRGVCVALVFLHHVANSGLPPAADPASAWQLGLQRLFMSFGYGVELFFMISGYVIVHSLRRHASVRAFLFDRVLRIFPVWLPLATMLCVASIATGRPGFDAAEPAGLWFVVFANLLLLPPLLPAPLLHPASWSLSYEWVFYLASAAAAGLARRRPGSPCAATGAWAAWALAVLVLIACFPRALFFLPGVLVALAPGVVRPLQRWPWLALPALPVFLLAWFATGVFAAQYQRPLWAVLRAGDGPAVWLALLAATTLFAVVCAPAGSRVAGLGCRAAQGLGTISYSFYLVHPLVMAAVKPLVSQCMPEARGSWATTLVFAIASALLAWGLSYLSWRVLEQGLARRIKAGWMRGRAAGPTRPAEPVQPACMRAKSGGV